MNAGVNGEKKRVSGTPPPAPDLELQALVNHLTWF
jgi:hypothetical protein